MGLVIYCVWQESLKDKLSFGEEDENAMTIDDMKAELEHRLKRQSVLTVFILETVIKLLPFVFVYLVYK